MFDIELTMTEGDRQVVLALSLLIIGFIIFWFTSESEKNKKKFFSSSNHDQSQIRWVFFQKYTGVLFLGIIPFLVAIWAFPYSLTELGLGFQNTLLSMAWIGGLAAIIIPININAGKRPQNLEMYPMIRVQKWDTKLVLLNALATVSYLFAYEFLFRGILLTVCVENLGIWPAIAINVALYSAVHLPKGPPETIGALPFGLLICLITLSTGTIWVAVVVHVILSLSNDYLAIHYSPKMHYKFK